MSPPHLMPLLACPACQCWTADGQYWAQAACPAYPLGPTHIHTHIQKHTPIPQIKVQTTTNYKKYTVSALCSETATTLPSYLLSPIKLSTTEEPVILLK